MSATKSVTDAFQDWSRDLFQEDFVRTIEKRLHLDPSITANFVRLSVEEAALTLELISPLLGTAKRLLEVGAGGGVLTAFLIARGVDLVAVDPGGDTFSKNEILLRALAERFAIGPERVVRLPVEAMDPDVMGRFDLIFSNNVLEHVSDFEACLEKLSALLAADGRMLHNCPNYDVPYEPHYGIPLLPLMPARTALLLPAHVREDGCWRSLNFVTYRRAKRVAAKLGRQIYFHRETTFNAFDRMLHAQGFATRHVALDRVGRLLRRAGLLDLLRFIPPPVATPMMFEIR